MSHILSIKGNNSGCLQISINTEGVKVQAEWTDCTNPDTHALGDDNEEQDPEQMYTVLVSIKSFLKFLNVHSVCSTTIACRCLAFYLVSDGTELGGVGLCHHHCLILYVYIGEVADAGGVLTFYIPAIIDDE